MTNRQEPEILIQSQRSAPRALYAASCEPWACAAGLRALPDYERSAVPRTERTLVQTRTVTPYSCGPMWLSDGIL